MNKENILKNLFWFAIGSFIALLVCINEVYADEIPVTFSGMSYYDVAGGNGTYCNLLNTDGTKTNCIWNYNTNGYQFAQITLVPSTLINDTYYTLDMSLVISLKTYSSNDIVFSNSIIYNNNQGYNTNDFEYLTNNYTVLDSYVDLDDSSYVYRLLVNFNGTIKRSTWVNNYFTVQWVNYPNFRIVEVLLDKASFNGVTDSTDVIINNQNQNQQQTNQGLENIDNSINDLNNTLTSDEEPDLSSLGDTAGWLPPGPLDTVLNLPLTLLNALTNIFSSECTSATLPLPYVDKNIELPCVSSLYAKIEGLDTFINWITIPLGAYILFKYFMHLYEWVDDTLTFRENNYIDNWGGV